MGTNNSVPKITYYTLLCQVLISNIVLLISVLCTAYLIYMGAKGWGWMVVVTILLMFFTPHIDKSQVKQDSQEEKECEDGIA